MHTLEPFYAWRDLYQSETDPYSPFFGRQYSEFEYSTHIYGYYIHPQWDDIGSATLFLKVLYVDYEQQVAILELLGEWNDCVQNDIMTLKRDFIDALIAQGITKYVLIGENVLNFHASDDCYYEEWFEDITEDDGWIILLNFRAHVLQEMQQAQLSSYLLFGGRFNVMEWRTFKPQNLIDILETMVHKKLNA